MSLAGGANLVHSSHAGGLSNTLAFSSFGTRADGSMVVFDTVTTGNTDNGTINITTAPGVTNGIIGGWAVRNRISSGAELFEWAAMSGSSVIALADANYSITTSGTSSDSWASTQNVKVTGFNQTLSDNRTIHSLNIQDTGGRTITIKANTVSTERSLVINSGGIISTRATHTIAGGKLIAGTHAGSLNQNQLVIYTPTNQLNITSVIADTTTRLTGDSSGVEVVTGLSSTTGLAVGMMLVSAGGFQGAAKIVSIDSSSQITLDRVVNAGSGLSFDFIQQSTSLVKAGASTLVLNPTLSIGTNGLMNPNSFDVTLSSGSFNTGIVVGATVTGAGIAAGTTVVGLVGNNAVTLSQQPLSAVASTLTFTLPNNYTGKTFINEGVLQIARESDLGLNPGTFTADQLTINGGILRVSADLVFNDSNRGITFGNADGVFRVADNRTLTIGAANTINGAAGRLVFSADGASRGVMVVAGNNDLSGGIETSGGRQETTGVMASTFSSGSTTVTVGTTAGLEVGASVTGNGIAPGVTIASITDGTTFELSAAAEADGTAENLTYGGFNTLKLTGNNTIGFVRVVGSTIALLGNNTLTGDIAVNSGLLRLGGDNQFNGLLNVTAGDVRFESNTGLRSTSGGYQLFTDGVVDLNGFSTTVSRLSGFGAVTNNGPTASSSILTVNATESFTFSGSLIDGLSTFGVLGLTKSGNGILTLANTGNTYSGATVIRGGGIRVLGLGFGGSASALGASSNASANLLFDGGSLRFNGDFTTFTDRSFTLGTGDNAGALIADGTVIGAGLNFGLAGFSPDVAFMGSGSRTLTLGGSNRGDNHFNLVLGDGAGGPTSVNKIGNGTWIMSAASTYKGETVVNAGILAATVNGAFGATGGAGVIIAGGTNGSTSLGNQNATVDLRNVAYTTVQNMFLAGGTLATSTGSSSWAGPVFVTANSSIIISNGAVLDLKGTLGGGNAIFQGGEGMLVLSGQVDTTTRNSVTNGIASPSHTIQAGTLRLDYSVNNNGKLSDNGQLVLGGTRFGGRLQLSGGSHVEIVAGTTVGAGRNFVERLSGTSKLRMNSIGRQTGATVDFSADDIASTDTDNVNGILGGWATVGGTTWATKSTFTEALVDSGVTTGADKLIRGLSAYTNVGALPGPLADEWAVNANMNVIGNSTQNTRTANTLRFHNSNNVAGNNPFRTSLTGINVLQSSGILFTPNMGAHSGVIEGTGFLTAGAGASSDLTILQNNTGSGSLEISAVIANLAPTGRSGTLNANNSITGVSLVGLAPGLTVTGTGINAGTIITAISVTDPVNQIGNLTISSNATGSGSAALSFNPVVNGLDKSGPGSLILSGLNVYTGTNTLNAGTTTIRTLAVEGYGSSTALISFAPSLGRSLADVSDVTGLTIGMNVTGSSISPGVTVTSVNAVNRTVALSNGALASLNDASVTFGSNITAKSGLQTATVTNGSSIVTIPGGTAGITIGQDVSGTGIPAGAKVIAINNTTQITIGQIVDLNTVAADPATANGTSVTFGSNSTAGGARTADTDSGTRIVVGSTLGMTVGQTVIGNGIPGSTTILRILDANTIELSNPVTVTGQNNLTYTAGASIGGTHLATTTGGSATVTVPSTANLSVGERVTGPGIPEGATVAAILSPTEILLSVSALFSGSNTLVFAGTASGLGASSNATSNIVFNGGILQFNGTTASTDRGFTINDSAIWDVGNAYSNLRLGGNYATPGTEEKYSLIKRGEGMLSMLGTAFGGYGVEELVVDDGVLRLMPAFTNQYIRSDFGALTLSGGTMELQSISGRNTTQNMIGTMQVREGASIVRVIGVTGSPTFLNLQDINSPTSVDFQKGGTVLFDVQGGPTVSQIILAGRALLDVGVLIPRVTFTNRSVNNPGVNDFGFVDSATSILSGSDIKGAHHFLSDTASWTGSRNVHDGALPEESFRGTTVSGASVNTILFFNNEVSLAGDRVIADPVITRVPGVDRLQVGMMVRGNGIPNNTIIVSIDQANNTVTLNNAPTLSDNTGLPLYFFDSSTTGDLAAGSTTVSNINDPRLKAGQTVFGTGIASGTTIISVDTLNNTVTLSQAATASGAGSTLYSEYLASTPAALNSSTVEVSDLLTLVSGAILQTTNAGNHVNSINGGLLTSGLANSDGTSADLIIHNWNPKEAFRISSSIVNNTALNRVVNLVQTGDGTTILSSANSYSGTTFVQGGVLRLDNAGALPASSHLRLDGGVLGLNAGDFTRSVGTGATQVDWTSSGGFAAYTTNRTVNLGGGGASVAWGSAGFVPDNTSLILGAQDANATVIFANGIDLGRKSRMIEAVSGQSATFADARITGVLDGDAGRIVKGGNGVLELAAVNTYSGGTSLAQGTLVGTMNGAFGTGRIEVGTTTDTRSAGMALKLRFQGDTLANQMTFGPVNGEGISVLSTTASLAVVTGAVEVARLPGQNLFIDASQSGNADFQGSMTGTGAITVAGGGVILSAANNFGTLAGQTSGAAVNGPVVVRSGALLLGHASALGSSGVIELGDVTPATLTADFATSGKSLLGVERDTQFIADNISGLGGAFEAQANGLVNSGFPEAGPGAFYNVSRVIDGVTFGSADIGKKILVKDEIDNPERNGVYQIVQVNQDLTMNLVRVADFSTTANMLYGTQVTVNGGTAAGQTFFMAAPSVTAVNAGGTDPVHWLNDQVNANVTLRVSNPSVTSVTQAIDVNANGTGSTTIASDAPVTFSGAVTLQDVRANVQETKTLSIDSGTTTGSGVAFSGLISEADGGSGPTDDILSLLKVNSGLATLSNATGNTYHGNTTVNAGTLQVTNTSGSGTGSGNVVVGAFATLAGSGTIAPGASKNVTVADLATIAPGTVGAGSGQSLTINLNGGTFDLQGILEANIFANAAGTTAAEADRLVLAGTGTATLGTFATLKVTSTPDPSTFVVGDTWQLIDWAGITPGGKFTGLDETSNRYVNDLNLPTLGSGLFWDINNLYTTGTLVVAVPEPGRLMLIILGFFALGWRRRRRWLF